MIETSTSKRYEVWNFSLLRNGFGFLNVTGYAIKNEYINQVHPNLYSTRTDAFVRFRKKKVCNGEILNGKGDDLSNMTSYVRLQVCTKSIEVWETVYSSDRENY